ncbi:MAG: dTDP-4-dehydrorhamnose reductase, partial [Burkholderiales bacterium]
RAESERDLAFAVNASSVLRLADQARKIDALLVHFSTDYVFDGEKKLPYVESDPSGPLNVYGESKLAGERAVAASGCRHFIFRTSWVYGPGGRNFLVAILAAAKAGRELRVVNDQHGAPTSSEDIARALAGMLSSSDFLRKPNGIYHLSAAGGTTWYEFARQILARKGLRTPVEPVSSAQYPAPARRPKNSLLDNGKLRATFGVALEDWRAGLAAVLGAVH